MPLELKDFTALKEIQSLDNFIKKHLDAIESEESRKDSINTMREKRKTEMVGLLENHKENTALINQYEKELFEWEKKRGQAEINQDRAKDQKQAEALEKEINQITPKCEELEERVLSLLEKNEEIDKLVKEAEVFLEGSLETLKEIDLEILEETKEERRHIENYEKRIEVLLENIPETLREAFHRARQKHRFRNPLARILNKACEKCRFEVDSQTKSQIDLAKAVIQCNQCERLLIPFDA
jgi:predicted  nucleic acid-binding Zn-ribbon protein